MIASQGTRSACSTGQYRARPFTHAVDFLSFACTEDQAPIRPRRLAELLAGVVAQDATKVAATRQQNRPSPATGRSTCWIRRSGRSKETQVPRLRAFLRGMPKGKVHTFLCGLVGMVRSMASSKRGNRLFNL